jgi:predicted Ser/Thr protein kinase/tetratricopeptide (TPR) repeat protein
MNPQRIGKYEITGKLGQGAMGEVFRGHDPILNREVAIKRISAGLDADENIRNRFMREAKAVAQLSHRNIITVYELGAEGDQAFMAMELLDGIDLKHAISQRQMTLDRKLDVVEQILEGLAFAHGKGIVHRDLKPANVHLLPNGLVKIMDFGLAKVSGSDMTATGTVMGTPHYMAPEQVRGLKTDARSDVFAVGCVFYELLSGRKPFDAESMHAVLFKVIQEEPPPLAEIAPGTPAPLVQVVEKALAKNPDERFANAGEMLEWLRRARQALASGRGNEPVAGLERTPGTPAAPPPRLPVRPVERSHANATRTGTSRHSVPPRSSGGRGLVFLGIAAALLALVGGALVVRRLVSPPVAAPTSAPGVQTMARELADTRAKLARRKLDGGDFTNAIRDAERALEMDPSNAEARTILDSANALQRRVAEAVAALRAATSDAARADAALALMKLDPANAEAETAARGVGAAFRSRAEHAKALTGEARRAAEQKGRGNEPAADEAAGIAAQGEQALRANDSVLAARRFLEARARYEQAAR